ncbi:MAG: aminotransferase class I/II-fold pyridoxal phosphate-dependent enzyme [Bacteroidetes bacterium]|nr:aminotransferase class I/II-fold pyridoxal phosphate-dependent enzyme [Bacteroidota bacterium]
MDTKESGFNTKLIHAGDFNDEYGSAVTPIYQTSTFRFKNAQHGADLFAGKEKGYIYTRIGNPTLNALENKLAVLENGYGAIVTSSGMAAVTTTYMTLLGMGKHIISTDAVYGPSRSVLENHFASFGVESTFINTSNIDDINKAIQPNTKVLFLETPANPTMQLTDITAACKIAHQRGLLVVVDNTFSTPYLQRPLDMGADIVVHSLTKFINGHADVVGGAIIAKEEGIYGKLRNTMIYMGCNMDPHQAYLVSRGIKTLAIRMERAQMNAMKIAKYLNDNPNVEWIKYPGLESHPQYELAKKQMTGFGTMISFGLKGGFEAGKKLMDNVKLTTLAVSLGGIESLIQHPASMTHAGISDEEKQKAGITDDLVRYSVGIEDVADLINDLAQAFNKIHC